MKAIRKGFLIYWSVLAVALSMSFGAKAESVVYLCYGQDTGIVGDGPQGHPDYETCSQAIAAGETIKPASNSSIPIEVQKPFDSASPSLRQFALDSQTINGYLVFHDVNDSGKHSKPLLKINFQNASLAKIKIGIGSNFKELGVEYIKLLPEQISWSVFDDVGGVTGEFSWDIGQNSRR